MAKRSLLRGVSVGVVSVVLSLAAATVVRLSLSTQPLSVVELGWFLSFMSFPVVGFLIVWHRPTNLLGWVYLAVGLAQTGGASSAALARLLSGRDPEGRVAALAWLGRDLGFMLAWVLATTIALVLFPDGRLPSRRWRPVVWICALGAVLTAGSIVVQPGPLGDSATPNPLAVPALGQLPDTFGTAVLYGMLALTLLCLTSLVHRWRKASGVEQAKLHWLAVAAVVILVLAGLSAVLEPFAPRWAGAVLEAVMVALLPTATGVAILRADLFDVTAVLDRTLIYAILAGAVALTYAGAIVVTTALLGAEADRVALLLSAVLVALLLIPAKVRLERFIDRWLYGERSRPYAMLAAVSSAFAYGRGDLMTAVTRSIAEQLRLPYVRVVRDGGEPLPADGFALPLVAHERQEGHLVAGHRSGGRAFSAPERQLLADLAHQLAGQVRSDRLARELQDSREAIVTAREEERLRVRRDLHDGIGPTLAAVTLQLDALQDRGVPDDTPEALLLLRIREEVKTCVVDIRQIVQGLRPPALDDLGLAGVIADHAVSLQAAGLRVEVTCPSDPCIGNAAAEVAAFRIVTEAMTNVIRHAKADWCAVTVGREADHLRLEVVDNGAGGARSGTAGLGLSSMRERAAELGGELAIRSTDTGTTITATIPLALAPGAAA